MSLSNASLLAEYAEFKESQHASHLLKVRADNPEIAHLAPEVLNRLFKSIVSCFQSKGGKPFEDQVEKRLVDAGIPFKAQVNIREDGIIVASGGCTIPDIVFGYPVIGDHISNYVVMSLKTTSRERGKLDDAWTRKTPPKLFLYATLASDYPQPERFGESDTRKLICATPRRQDTRKFKLGFEDLQSLLA
jgi:hypothetical protein